MTSSYNSMVRSTENKGVTFLFGTWNFIIIFPCLGEAKVSTVNSDLTNFVDVQRLHENILSCLPRIRSRQYLFISQRKSYFPLKLSTASPQEKSSHKKNHAYPEYFTCSLKKCSYL